MATSSILFSKPFRSVLSALSLTCQSRNTYYYYSTTSAFRSPTKSKELDSIFQRINWEKLINDDSIMENVKRRQESANIDQLRQLWKQLQSDVLSSDRRIAMEETLVQEALAFPNDTHSSAVDCGNTPNIIRVVGKPLLLEKPKDIQELCEPRGYLKRNNLGDFIGTRPYILQGFLAELEQALIKYSMTFLKDEGFQFISVPDFLYSDIIESCGFPVNSERTMVYEIETKEGEQPIYLSGTSELAIGGYLSNRTFSNSELPLKLAAISRCFRAETSSIEEERGIFRVHNFSKVEMFSVTKSEDSEEFHAYICQLQEKLFKSLGLHFRIMEMSPNELGTPAYRKFDIEAWMPGRKQFGEISSCSNCTDYQARRLNIRYKNGNDGNTHFAHTLNGTACAIPRMLIAIIESCQTNDEDMILPPVLEKYMHSKWRQNPIKGLPPMFMKNRKQQEKVVLRYDPY